MELASTRPYSRRVTASTTPENDCAHFMAIARRSMWLARPAAARSPRSSCHTGNYRERWTLPASSARTWSVLIADDEPPARRGVRQLLAAFPSFMVVGECRDGAEVLAALDTLHPDVVFLDVQMPGI